MHIIIAPNAFKHSLSAFAVADAIKAGFEKSGLPATYAVYPIADGGEGITDILVRHLKGQFRATTVQDALGRNIKSYFGLINNKKTAVIELANASGSRWLQPNEFNPELASTYGTGQLILNALNLGIRDFIIGLGNSATVDGGTGLLQALGIKFFDDRNQPLALGAKALGKLATIDVSGLDPRLSECTITVACDVENVLLGATGAARVFGPQKGANAAMVDDLERYLTNLNEVVKKYLGKDMAFLKYGGAAGGTATALATFLEAKLVSGIHYLSDLTHFSAALPSADLLVTAEGGLDNQTLAGKGPYGIAQLAQKHNVPVIVLAGQIPDNLDLSKFTCFDAVFPIGTGPVSLAQALAYTTENLNRTAWQIGNLLKLGLTAK